MHVHKQNQPLIGLLASCFPTCTIDNLIYLINMPSERRRVPLSLQAVFVASNRGQYVNSPPPGNVAIRVFQSIFKRPLSHRFSRRTYKYVDSATKKEVGLIIPSSTNEVLHKPISHHQQQTDHNDNKCETSCSNIEMEIPRQSRDLYVNYPSASYRSSNATTIACSVDSEDLNYDNLYSSPVKYKAKVSIKALVRYFKMLLELSKRTNVAKAHDLIYLTIVHTAVIP